MPVAVGDSGIRSSPALGCSQRLSGLPFPSWTPRARVSPVVAVSAAMLGPAAIRLCDVRRTMASSLEILARRIRQVGIAWAAEDESAARAELRTLAAAANLLATMDPVADQLADRAPSEDRS